MSYRSRWLSALRVRAAGKEVGSLLAKLTAHARPIVVLAALALLVDLFFTWREAPVKTEWLNDNGGATALGGWGAIAAALLALFLMGQFATTRRARVISGVLAVAAAGFTFAEFFTGSANPASAIGVVTVSTEATLWPAYLGLVLAVVLVAAAVSRVVQPPPARYPLPPLLARIPAQPKAVASWWA
jgi:membrane associated rhomboid family serine protease